MKSKRIRLLQAAGIAIAAIAISSWMTEDASAQCRVGGVGSYGYGYGGYGGVSARINIGSSYNHYRPSYNYRSYNSYYRPRYVWHDTTHLDWHPGQYVRHRNHYDYIPGHYDVHRTGHWDRY